MEKRGKVGKGGDYPDANAQLPSGGCNQRVLVCVLGHAKLCSLGSPTKTPDLQHEITDK